MVGSGPAGFYTAQRILKLNSQVEVDIIERLPTPFGLVRLFTTLYVIPRIACLHIINLRCRVRPVGRLF